MNKEEQAVQSIKDLLKMLEDMTDSLNNQASINTKIYEWLAKLTEISDENREAIIHNSKVLDSRLDSLEDKLNQ